MKEPRTFNEAVHLVAEEIASLVEKKQADYGQGNILAFGADGILVRVSDKVERLKNLRGKVISNEPVTDSWRDLAGYSILALLLEKGWFTLPLKDE